MARIITGKVTKVSASALPPEGEVLGWDGNQIWYGDPDGLGSTTAKDITRFFVPGSLQLGSSDEGEES